MPTTSSSSSLRYALVLLVGVALGAGFTVTVGSGIFGSDAVNEDDALGTFLPPRSLDRLDLIGRETFDTGGLTGAIETRSIRGMVLMEVTVDSDVPGVVEVSFDGEALSPRGFSQEKPTGEIQYQEDRYRVTTSGPNRYQLTFRARSGDEASTIQLRLRGEGDEQVIEVGVNSNR